MIIKTKPQRRLTRRTLPKRTFPSHIDRATLSELYYLLEKMYASEATAKDIEIMATSYADAEMHWAKGRYYDLRDGQVCPRLIDIPKGCDEAVLFEQSVINAYIGKSYSYLYRNGDEE